MTASYPNAPGAGGLLGWLGLKPRTAPFAATPPAPGLAPAGPDRRNALRARQLGEIGAFLERHRLDVTGSTLAVAHSYLTRSDAHVVRLLDRRVQSGRPITMEWINDAVVRAERQDEITTLGQLMERLEASIDDFGRTSQDAHKATSEYSSAMAEHVVELERVTVAGTVISELAGVAKVMLKRTREIEKQMLRSEAQTRALKRRLEQTRRAADEDHLTGLPNRRAFEALFEREYTAARAAGENLCVAFCDIDHFKLINDHHGHEAGDRILKVVAESLDRISDERCHVARHGGEEFVMLFRAVPLDEAQARLDNLRRCLSERNLVNRATDKPFGPITFSGGVADVFAYGDRGTALRAADGALYRAKQAGRNRIERAGPDDALALAA